MCKVDTFPFMDMNPVPTDLHRHPGEARSNVDPSLSLSPINPSFWPSNDISPFSYSWNIYVYTYIQCMLLGSLFKPLKLEAAVLGWPQVFQSGNILLLQPSISKYCVPALPMMGKAQASWEETSGPGRCFYYLSSRLAMAKRDGTKIKWTV